MHQFYHSKTETVEKRKGKQANTGDNEKFDTFDHQPPKFLLNQVFSRVISINMPDGKKPEFGRDIGKLKKDGYYRGTPAYRWRLAFGLAGCAWFLIFTGFMFKFGKRDSMWNRFMWERERNIYEKRVLTEMIHRRRQMMELELTNKEKAEGKSTVGLPPKQD